MRFGLTRWVPALGLLLSPLFGTNVNADVVVYSDTTNYSGLAFANGGATVQAGNDITRMVADDITVGAGYAGATIDAFNFSVGNLNTAAVSARARIRFYANDGTGGGPGTYLTGFTFNPISFAPGVTVYTYAPNTPLFVVPTGGTFWAGLTFDDNTGTTGATAAQLNNLGQGIYAPPTIGTSQDIFFETTAAGSFVQNGPPGSFYFFGGNPVADFGFSFSGTPLATVPEPSTTFLAACGLAIVGAKLLRKRSARTAA